MDAGSRNAVWEQRRGDAGSVVWRTCGEIQRPIVAETCGVVLGLFARSIEVDLPVVGDGGGVAEDLAPVVEGE